MTNIIKCRFLNENGEPKGNEYTYKTEFPVEVGQLVEVPAPRHSDVDIELKAKTVIVLATDVPEKEIAAFKDRVKTIIKIHESE